MFGKVNEDSFHDILDLSNSSYQLGSSSSSSDSNDRFLALSRAFKLESSTLLLSHPEDDSSCSSLISNTFVPSLLHHPRNKTCLLTNLSSDPLFPTEQKLIRSPIGSGSAGGPFSSSSSSTSSSSSSLSSSSSSVANSDSSNPSNAKVNTSRYKTELCRPYQENGSCKYGEKCQFAHGQHELRSVSRHPKYKTDLCRTYHSVGFCPYGPRCHFIHNLEEIKQQQAQQQQQRNTAALAAAQNGSGQAANGMPPLPMFSTQPSSSSSSSSVRQRHPSESGYTSSGSSSSQSPSSFIEMDSDSSDSPSLAQNLSIGSPSRLPVFSTLSK